MGKEDVKPPLFLYNMISYIENPRDSTEILLELINSVKLHDIK